MADHVRHVPRHHFLCAASFQPPSNSQEGAKQNEIKGDASATTTDNLGQACTRTNKSRNTQKRDRPLSVGGRERRWTLCSSFQSLLRPGSSASATLGGAEASFSERRVAPQYVELDRAGLGSRTVLARVDNLGRAGLADSKARFAGRSGDRVRSDSRLVRLGRPLGGLETGSGGSGDGRLGGASDASVSEGKGLIARGGLRNFRGSSDREDVTLVR